jgi:predicted ATPase
MQSGLLFRQGIPPHATYLFKHALVQDAAYGTLLREPRRALQTRIAETLEVQFPEIAENQPELLARHCTEAGLIEKAAGFWGKAGQRSLGRKALVEAVAQLTTTIDQMAALAATPALRRAEIKVQVALAKALMHTKGYAATETKAAIERARSLIERAEALGEPPDDPLLLFSVLNGFWTAAYVSLNGEAICEIAEQFLALAKKQKAIFPLILGHRLMGTSLTTTGDLVRGRAHYDEAMLLCESAERPALTTRFEQAIRVSVLSDRAVGLWMLGYPDAALADSETALEEVRGSGNAVATLHTVAITALMKLLRRDYAQVLSQCNENVVLADAKGALFYGAHARLVRAWLMALTGESLEAVRTIKVELTSLQSTGSRNIVPLHLAHLAMAYADLGQFGDAQHAIDEATQAVETTGERWWEAEVYRVAGEIALKSKSPEHNVAKAQAYFERALTVARHQQAKSWELRAAISTARLWRDQGKRDEARELLAPVYGWFTEWFDTLDLKEAKALLDELASQTGS